MPDAKQPRGPASAAPPQDVPLASRVAPAPHDGAGVFRAALPSDDTLVRARAGDADAFRDLVERHSRAVFHVAYRVTGRVEDAEDVVQETFLRAYRQLDRFESRANFGTWLHRIAINCAVDLLRGRSRREVPEEQETLDRLGGELEGAMPSPERAMLGMEIRERIGSALERLTDMERAAFTLRHFEGLSIEEIGRTLGLRTNATKHSIFRAVRKMRQELKPFIEA
jgi:RNA polymerase sigma-70 factor (ECF subfamily)